MARSARTAPTTAQRAPSRQETLPAASSSRSAQTPPPPASTASSPNPMQQSTPLILYHGHCSWLMQRFPNRPGAPHADAAPRLCARRNKLALNGGRDLEMLSLEIDEGAKRRLTSTSPVLTSSNSASCSPRGGHALSSQNVSSRTTS